MTARLVEHLVERAPRESFRRLADQTGVTEGTVRRLWKDRPGPAEPIPLTAPRLLGMDETKLCGKLRGVLTDLGSPPRLIAILDDRKSATFAGAFEGMAGKETTEAVCIDLCAAYRTLAQAHFPKAAVVADRWHVQKMANHALDEVRKAVRKDLPEAEKMPFFRQRFVLMRRRRDLDEDELALLDSWTTSSPLLGEAHRFKERFSSLWDCPTAADAKLLLADLRSGLRPGLEPFFSPMLATCGRWEAEILAAFDHDVTNAGTEGINGRTKEINRLGHGYGFDVIKSKAMAAFGVPSASTPCRE